MDEKMYEMKSTYALAVGIMLELSLIVMLTWVIEQHVERLWVAIFIALSIAVVLTNAFGKWLMSRGEYPKTE